MNVMNEMNVMNVMNVDGFKLQASRFTLDNLTTKVEETRSNLTFFKML